MYVKMKQTLHTATGAYLYKRIYEVDDVIGEEWDRKKVAARSTEPPPHIAELLARLEDGAGESCLFLPFVGEFGHEILTHIRIVHFHRAAAKVVCCRPGSEILYPSASAHVTDWKDPIPDERRAGTIREGEIFWPEIVNRFPSLHQVPAGGLTYQQEMYAIEPDARIPFRPKRRGLRVDVVFGVRRRAFAPEKNWQHWQKVADAIARAGYSFAVIGARETSDDLRGQRCHSGDLDTDAAIELLQNCRLYVGSDSGNSHLASTVGASMLIFREPRNGMRDFVPRMKLVNPDRIEFDAEGWDNPESVIVRTLETLRASEVPREVAVA
jgi:hypothetical protein